MSYKDSPLTYVALVLSAVAATAVTTYTLTKRNEEAKQKAILNRQYQREQMLKQKTAEARKKTDAPPSGTLLDDVKVDKVYLWECEDLRTKFNSALVENTMRCKPNSVPSILSPHLRHAIPSEDSRSTGEEQITQYNTLISDHECILGKNGDDSDDLFSTIPCLTVCPLLFLPYNNSYYCTQAQCQSEYGRIHASWSSKAPSL